MTTQDELPAWLTDALDKPLVGPVALVVVVAVAVLVITRALAEWNRHVNRELERHRLLAKIARPEAEFESTASHWHKPPVTWTDDDSTHIEAEQVRAEVARVQAWGDEPGVRK